jgi:hypothetical protein
VFQTATAAEPLNLHGWQLVDELNRLLAHRPVSGYVAPVHLVTPENVGSDGGPRLRYRPCAPLRRRACATQGAEGEAKHAAVCRTR